jgi:tetratricopeptide (TPR) repeat protein
MIRVVPALLLLASAASQDPPPPATSQPSVGQAPYGQYDADKALVTKTAEDGTEESYIDLAYVDEMLDDLWRHARDYPTKFASAEDRERATLDARQLQPIVDVLAERENASPQNLRRAALLYSMAHNLDVPDAAEKAHGYFQKWIARDPKDAAARYHFGMFLTGSGSAATAIPHFEEALRLGETQARWGLGMAYLYTGQNEKALEQLEAYARLHPDHEHAAMMIAAIREGRVKINSEPGTSSQPTEKPAADDDGR